MLKKYIKLENNRKNKALPKLLKIIVRVLSLLTISLGLLISSPLFMTTKRKCEESQQRSLVNLKQQYPDQPLTKLLEEYVNNNQDFSDASSKKLLTITRQLDETISTGNIPADLENYLGELMRDEYASKHFELDTACKNILDKTSTGQRMKKTLQYLETGEFVDQAYNEDFLKRIFPEIRWRDANNDNLAQWTELSGVAQADWLASAGKDLVLDNIEAQNLKRSSQIFEYILPSYLQYLTGQEKAYLRPGDLLFTGNGRKRDDTSGFLGLGYFTTPYWGNLFEFYLGMKRMHVGAYIGSGSVMESGKDEEGKKGKTPGWSGTVQENIYDSIFSSDILNGITVIENFPKQQRLKVIEYLLKYEGIDYNFLHLRSDSKLDCIELINIVYKKLQLLPESENDWNPEQLYQITKNILEDSQ